MSFFITNKDIADILYKVAELLEIENADRFRVMAYRNAAVTVRNTREPFTKKFERGDDLLKLMRSSCSRFDAWSCFPM